MCPLSPLGFGTVSPRLDCSEVVDLLERQRADGWQLGAQCYVSVDGEAQLDVAMGEARPGQALETDDVMLWYSSGKPVTTVAVLQLWEQGRLRLDDQVGDFIDGWGGGKERCTIRHVLTHTGGFPMYRDTAFDEDVSYADAIARIAASRAMWEPGTAAGYHPVTGWKVLGRDRGSGRRPSDRALRARRDPRPARARLDVPRDTARHPTRTRSAHRACRMDRAHDAGRRRRWRAEHGAVSHRRRAQ